MKLALRIERNRFRIWHEALIRRLAKLGHRVTAEFADPLPMVDGVALLLDVERCLLRRGRPAGCDPAVPASQDTRGIGDQPPHITIDLTATPVLSPQGATLAVLYDGVGGEDTVFTALLSGAAPVTEIVDAATGRVLERAHASLEVAVGVGGGLDAVAARIVTGLVACIEAIDAGVARPAPPDIARSPRGPARSPRRLLASEIARAAAHAVYRLCCHAPHWRVGWRFNDGPGVLERGDLGGPPWQVLPDPGAHFYADPFPVCWRGEQALLFEDLDHRTGKGIISVVRMSDAGPLGPAEPVLDEPWHLSYPFPLEYRDELYMIPESSLAGEVALYRCTAFPHRWERVATLLQGVVLADATVFQHGDRWWMTGVGHDGSGGYSDTLMIYSAPDLFGPWIGHPANPILIDRAQARPAGAVIVSGGKLWRPVQDCSRGYGMALAIAEITRLDNGGFTQRIHHRIVPGGPWPGRKVHTLNRVGRLEAIDGSVIRPKPRLLAALVERHHTPSG